MFIYFSVILFSRAKCGDDNLTGTNCSLRSKILMSLSERARDRLYDGNRLKDKRKNVNDYINENGSLQFIHAYLYLYLCIYCFLCPSVPHHHHLVFNFGFSKMRPAFYLLILSPFLCVRSNFDVEMWNIWNNVRLGDGVTNMARITMRWNNF